MQARRTYYVLTYILLLVAHGSFAAGWETDYHTASRTVKLFAKYVVDHLEATTWDGLKISDIPSAPWAAIYSFDSAGQTTCVMDRVFYTDYGLDSNTLSYGYYISTNASASNYTYKFSRSITGVYISITIRGQDLYDYDVSCALRERFYAAGLCWTEYLTIGKDNVANARMAKERLDQLIQKAWSKDGDYAMPFVASNLYIACNSPSNYTQWIDNKTTFGGPSYPRVMTILHTIDNPSYPTNIVTNTIHLYPGGTTNVVGVHGNKFSMIITNNSIADGFETKDYSITNIQRIINKLTLFSCTHGTGAQIDVVSVAQTHGYSVDYSTSSHTGYNDCDPGICEPYYVSQVSGSKEPVVTDSLSQTTNTVALGPVSSPVYFSSTRDGSSYEVDSFASFSNAGFFCTLVVRYDANCLAHSETVRETEEIRKMYLQNARLQAVWDRHLSELCGVSYAKIYSGVIYNQLGTNVVSVVCDMLSEIDVSQACSGSSGSYVTGTAIEHSKETHSITTLMADVSFACPISTSNYHVALNGTYGISVGVAATAGHLPATNTYSVIQGLLGSFQYPAGPSFSMERVIIEESSASASRTHGLCSEKPIPCAEVYSDLRGTVAEKQWAVWERSPVVSLSIKDIKILADFACPGGFKYYEDEE